MSRFFSTMAALTVGVIFGSLIQGADAHPESECQCECVCPPCDLFHGPFDPDFQGPFPEAPVVRIVGGEEILVEDMTLGDPVEDDPPEIHIVKGSKADQAVQKALEKIKEVEEAAEEQRVEEAMAEQE